MEIMPDNQNAAQALLARNAKEAKKAYENLSSSRKVSEEDPIKKQQNLFAKMIVAETQKMDPFGEQKDSSHFLTQLLQMHGAEQAAKSTKVIQQMNKTIEILVQMNKASLQGNDIKLKGNDLIIQENKARFEYTLIEDAQALNIFIQDKNKHIVQNLNITDTDYLKAGTHSIEWDSKDFKGKALDPDALYRLKFNATNTRSKPMLVQAAAIANIKEINLNGNAREINIGKQAYDLENLIIVQKENMIPPRPSSNKNKFDHFDAATKARMIKHSPYI